MQVFDLGGVHLYLGYKGIATDSGFSGVIVAYTIATNVNTHRCSGHYLLMRIVPIVRIYMFGI
jgi:hypothetical protein